MIAYCLPIYCSIYYLVTGDLNPKFVAFACLFLDFKFLSLFSLFEKYNMYFSIILRVATKLVYFLVFLVILVFGFAHAFYILLKPENDYPLDQPTFNEDPNNPWNLVPTFYRLSDDKKNIASTIVLAPDDS